MLVIFKGTVFCK